MSKLRSAKRRLKQDKIWIAEETQHQKIKFFQQAIAERVKTDVEFAKDVLKAVGENLPSAIKKAAEESIAKVAAEKVIFDELHPHVPMSSNGSVE